MHKQAKIETDSYEEEQKSNRYLNQDINQIIEEGKYFAFDGTDREGEEGLDDGLQDKDYSDQNSMSNEEDEEETDRKECLRIYQSPFLQEDLAVIPEDLQDE